MSWGCADPEGVLVGDAEVAQVERLRLKRAFEAALPPVSDKEKLPLR